MLTFKIPVEYKPGDIVYLKTDTEQLKHIVSGYLTSEKDIQYEIKIGENISYHYGYELSPEEDSIYRIDKS